MSTKVKVMPERNRLRRAAMMRSYINVKKIELICYVVRPY